MWLTVGLKALNAWPAAGCLYHRLHYRHGPKSYRSKSPAGMCSLIRLTSFCLPFFFLLGEQQGQDDGRQRSSMLSSPTPSHYFISLLLIPHQLSGFNLPWCLVLIMQNCASEIECVLVFWTLVFCIHIASGL